MRETVDDLGCPLRRRARRPGGDQYPHLLPAQEPDWVQEVRLACYSAATHAIRVCPSERATVALVVVAAAAAICQFRGTCLLTRLLQDGLDGGHLDGLRDQHRYVILA